MSHSNTDSMLAYWRSRRGVGPAPARADIDPAAFVKVMPQTFMLGREAAGDYRVRLAGSLIESLHDDRLAGSDFLALWAEADRTRVKAAIESALLRGEAVLARATGRTAQDRHADFELLLMPLVGPSGGIDRLLGLYQPVTPLSVLKDESVERLFLLQIGFVGPEDAKFRSLRLAAVDGRRIA